MPREASLPSFASYAQYAYAEATGMAYQIHLEGDVQGSALVDGSQDVTLHTAVAALTNLELEEMLK